MNTYNNGVREKETSIRLLLDYFHRMSMHHAYWFAQVQQEFGTEKAFEFLTVVQKQSSEIQMKRLSKIFGFEIESGIPEPLLQQNVDKINEILEGVAINWLAQDGIWFQTIENNIGMTEAKKCNDAAWADFSPFEARSIKAMLAMKGNVGLEGLKKALSMRLYASVNKQEIVDETAESFVFRMINCRVQSARKLKGLNDYPCKSAGIIEYSTFAKTIDSNIHTSCIGCPPDPHPDSWCCAWKFSI